MYTFKECVEHLAGVCRLTQEERQQLLPSGRQEVLKNRVGWAKWHLQLADLLQYPTRGLFRITERGRQVLREQPAKIDLRILRQQPGYLEACHGLKDTSDDKINEERAE